MFRGFLAATAMVGLVGCWSNTPYRLVVENAVIASGPSAATTWCKDGSIPAISVIARTATASGTTVSSRTLQPIWDQGILVAYASDYDRGVRIDVRGVCPEGAVHIGAARVVPGGGVYGGRALVVHGVGGATQLRLHWEGLRQASGGSTGVYFDGGYYEDDSVGYYDAGGDYVDTSSDASGGGTDTPSDVATCDSSDTCVDTSSTSDTSSTDTSSMDTSSTDSSASTDGTPTP